VEKGRKKRSEIGVCGESGGRASFGTKAPGGGLLQCPEREKEKRRGLHPRNEARPSSKKDKGPFSLRKREGRRRFHCRPHSSVLVPDGGKKEP